MRYKCEREGSQGHWVHNALGINSGGDDGHICDLVTPLTTYSDENYARILSGLDWSCGSCLKVQNDNDAECCGQSARDQLKGHLFALASLAMETKPGPCAKGQGNLATMRELIDAFLRPHATWGLTPTFFSKFFSC